MSVKFEKSPWRVEVKADYLSKVSSCNPERALAELIWNSLDADAHEVEVLFVDGPLGTVTEVIVRDNGEGFKAEEAKQLFTSLGGSWKATKTKSTEGRFLHGKEGQGRFKAFALGRSIEWKVTYKQAGELSTFVIDGLSDHLDQFDHKILPNHNARTTGVTVKIVEPNRQFHVFDPDVACQKLLPIFALYLSTYKDTKVHIGGILLDPESAISRKKKIPFQQVTHEGQKYDIDMDLIEWKNSSEKELWFCDANGFPIEKHHKQIRSIGNFGFSGYLRSSLFEKLDQQGILGLGDLNKELRDICDTAIKKIKEYFSQRVLEEGQEQVRKWKTEQVYPYKHEAQSPVEVAERQVFDIVAVKVSETVPSFTEGDKKSQAFQLRMLRHAVETSPVELQEIIAQVLNLPPKQRDELSDLLQDVSLAGMISASKLVTDRLKFITGLEHLIFEESNKKNLKERSQLHRIIAQNSWIFGPEFSLSVDDQSLTEVLRKHHKKLGSEVVIDKPVKRVDSRTGIIDLMMSRSIPSSHDDEIEHLVVELKAPKVKIDHKECSQIESYAFAVTEDERFTSLKATWNFWVISNELGPTARRKAKQENYKRGVIYKSNETVNLTIWVKTWSQIIRENKHRLEFVREKLEYTADKAGALDHLRKAYSDFTKGVILEDSPEEEGVGT